MADSRGAQRRESGFSKPRAFRSLTPRRKTPGREPRSHRSLSNFAATTHAAIIDSLAQGAPEIKIHGSWVRVAAEVVPMKNFSAHADAGELTHWVKGDGKAPKRIFITHGEPAAADMLRQRIRRTLGWEAETPEYRDTVTLD